MDIYFKNIQLAGPEESLRKPAASPAQRRKETMMIRTALVVLALTGCIHQVGPAPVVHTPMIGVSTDGTNNYQWHQFTQGQERGSGDFTGVFMGAYFFNLDDQGNWSFELADVGIVLMRGEILVDDNENNRNDIPEGQKAYGNSPQKIPARFLIGGCGVLVWDNPTLWITPYYGECP